MPFKGALPVDGKAYDHTEAEPRLLAGAAPSERRRPVKVRKQKLSRSWRVRVRAPHGLIALVFIEEVVTIIEKRKRGPRLLQL